MPGGRRMVSPPVASPTRPIINVVAEAEATGFAKALTGLHEDYRPIRRDDLAPHAPCRERRAQPHGDHRCH